LAPVTGTYFCDLEILQKFLDGVGKSSYIFRRFFAQVATLVFLEPVPMPDDPVAGAEPVTPDLSNKVPSPPSVLEAMQAAEAAVAEAVAGMKQEQKIG
jgi:hypothetical protein